MLNNLGVEDLSLEDLEQLFDDNSTQATPPADNTIAESVTSQEQQENSQEQSKSSSEVTKAFAKRLKESTDKAVAAEREAIAKKMGYDSYENMLSANERKLIEDKGLDPDEVSPVVEELVQQRLNNNPLMKELENFRRQRIEEFGQRELAEITALTGGEITKLSQLPKEVIDLWKTKGSLKSAYMQLEGEKLITRLRSEQSKGSTAHLNNPGSSVVTPDTKRPLTQEERNIWKFFNPNISDEELNKKTIDK